jgi:hypothetical protein
VDRSELPGRVVFTVGAAMSTSVVVLLIILLLSWHPPHAVPLSAVVERRSASR